jgi:hypothetical protein
LTNPVALLGSLQVSFNRDKERDRRRTRDVISGGHRADEDDPSKNWLGHFVNKGTGRLDQLLLAGATWEALDKARGAVDEHLYHLRTEHGLCIVEQDGRLKFA